MDFEDVTTNSPNNTLTDRSPDSGVSMDSMDSAPAEAPTGFAALPKVCMLPISFQVVQ